MSLVKRIGDLEDSLTPRQAVILWMREAHEFDSLLGYGLWLMDQPDGSYPLIKDAPAGGGRRQEAKQGQT